MLLSAGALAEEEAPKPAPIILTGKVEAKETVTVYAPFGGTVQDYTVRAGDAVAEGDVLFTLDTIKVYAPLDGTVRGIFAEEGDTAAYVQGIYGALCSIEPDNQLTVQATSSERYDSEENRYLHLGETVYIRSTSGDRKGVGRLIQQSGETFSVEVESGTLRLTDNVNLYRDSRYEAESRIGRGIVMRTSAVPVSGEGAVVSIAVQDGQTVARGDVLFELVSGTLDGMQPVSPEARAPQDGIVASVSAVAGQASAKNQPLASIYLMEQLQLVSSVSEEDIGRVAVGDAVRITFDNIADTTYEGTVASISGLGTPTENYASYTVYVDFTPDDSVRLGMSAIGYLQSGE